MLSKMVAHFYLFNNTQINNTFNENTVVVKSSEQNNFLRCPSSHLNKCVKFAPSHQSLSCFLLLIPASLPSKWGFYKHSLLVILCQRRDDPFGGSSAKIWGLKSLPSHVIISWFFSLVRRKESRKRNPSSEQVKVKKGEQWVELGRIPNFSIRN